MNSVVIRGTLSGTPLYRSLASGAILASFDVATSTPSGVVAVPVTWFDPPASAQRLETGDEVVVCGTVQRRFFRSSGVTQARTDVVAAHVVPARRRAQAQRVLQSWLAKIGDAATIAVQPLPSSANDSLSRSTKLTSPARSQTRGS